MDKSLPKQRDKQQMKPRKNRKIKNTNQNNKSRRKKNKVRKKKTLPYNKIVKWKRI